MSTRTAFTPTVHLSAFGDRPRLFIDAGFKRWSFWFDDCNELACYLIEAMRHDGLPSYAANYAHDYVQRAFGCYEDDNFDGAERPSLEATPSQEHGCEETHPAEVFCAPHPLWQAFRIAFILSWSCLATWKLAECLGVVR